MQGELLTRGLGVRWVAVVVGAVAEQVSPRRTLRWARRIGEGVVGVWTVLVVPSCLRLVPMSQEGLTHLRFLHLTPTVYVALVTEDNSHNGQHDANEDDPSHNGQRPPIGQPVTAIWRPVYDQTLVRCPQNSRVASGESVFVVGSVPLRSTGPPDLDDHRLLRPSNRFRFRPAGSVGEERRVSRVTVADLDPVLGATRLVDAPAQKVGQFDDPIRVRNDVPDGCCATLASVGSEGYLPLRKSQQATAIARLLWTGYDAGYRRRS